jgi:hypothetical protein
MQRGLSALVLVVCTAFGTPSAARDEHHETRILHQDGTGTATIVEVPKDIPGVAGFLQATPAPIPQPGEIVLPPSATPTTPPAASPTPRR